MQTRTVAVFAALLIVPGAATSQSTTDTTGARRPGQGELALSQAEVDVSPAVRDKDIQSRLQRVLEATEWFTAPTVRVEEGVVFLGGTAPSEELRKWAGDLARNTTGRGCGCESD